MRNERVSIHWDLHSLISLEKFKSLAGVDDRDDNLSCFVLEASLRQIERVWMRRMLSRNIEQCVEWTCKNDFLISEYTVRAVLSVRVKKLFSIHCCLLAVESKLLFFDTGEFC